MGKGAPWEIKMMLDYTLLCNELISPLPAFPGVLGANWYYQANYTIHTHIFEPDWSAEVKSQDGKVTLELQHHPSVFALATP